MTSVVPLHAGIRGRTAYLYEMECIRGVAILLVLLFHVYGISGIRPTNPDFWLSYIIGGNTGVTLFFMLSGFLLSLPWLRYCLGETESVPQVRNYAVARVLRIVPLYWLAVIVSVLLSGSFVVGTKAALFQFVGFDLFPYSVVWWTLTTEVQFYLMLPFAWIAFIRPGWTRWLVVGLLLAWLVSYISVFIYPGSEKPIRSYWLTKSLFGRMPAFLIGIAAALVYLKLQNPFAANSTLMKRMLATLLCVGACLALGWILFEVISVGEKRAEWAWHIHHSYEAILWALLTLLLLLTKPFGKRLLVNRPFAVMGKLSYSLYLNHVPILFFLIYPTKEAMGTEAYIQSSYLYLLPLAAIFLSLGLAVLTYRFIELPFLNLKHKIPV